MKSFTQLSHLYLRLTLCNQQMSRQQVIDRIRGKLNKMGEGE